MKKTVAILLVFVMLTAVFAMTASADTTLWSMDFDSADHWSGTAPEDFPADPPSGMGKGEGEGVDGSDAWKLDAAGNYAYANCPIITIEGNKTYKVSCKFKVVEAGRQFFYVQWVQEGVSGTQMVHGMEWGAVEGLNGGYVDVEVSEDWETFEYVYEAPEDAVGLRFGPCVYGNEILLVDDMKIEVVGDDASGDEGSSETGDTTVLFAVFAVVALFGSAVVLNKVR